MSQSETRREIRLFVSSPGDVAAEREAVGRVIERLNSTFRSTVHVHTIRWEQDYYTADRTFQAKIENPESCDLVVCILWSRLGSELPPDFERMPDGRPYPSGTVYEMLKALEAKSRRGLPDVLVYRKTLGVVTPVEDPEAAQRVQDQLAAVHRFWTERFVSEQGHFLAGYHSFKATDEFETKFEAHLRKWLADAGLLGKPVAWPIAEKGSPFRGLEPFDVEHEQVLFGRSAEIERAVALLQKGLASGTPFLLITGESGAGKSSLARAGVIPRLMRLPGPEGADVWRLARLRPGGADPLRVLAEALFAKGALPELASSDYGQPSELRELIVRGGGSAVRPVVRTLERIGRDWARTQGLDRAARARLVVLLDQLEELFAGNIEAEARERFAAACATLVESGAVVLIATLRADAYPLLLGSDALLRLKSAGATLDVRSPDKAQIREIVTHSAEAAGLSFETDAETKAKLSEILVEDAAGQDALPLLQFALQRLYDAMAARLSANGRGVARAEAADLALRIADYRAFGGLEGALQEAAERAFGQVGSEAKARLPRLVRALFRRGEAGYTVQSAPLAHFAKDGAALRLIEALVAARILVRGGESEAGIRFAHEAVRRSWPRVAEIIGSSETFYRVRADVLAAQARWAEARRRKVRAEDYLIPPGVPLAEAERMASDYADELAPETLAFIARAGQRARRRQRWLQAAAAAFAALFVASAAAGIYAWTKREEAKAAQELAVMQLLAMQARRGLADATPIGIERAGALALESIALARKRHRPSEADAVEAVRGALVGLPGLVLRHGGELGSLAVLGDGRLASGGFDGIVEIWPKDGAGEPVRLRPGSEILALAVLKDGRLASGGADGTVEIWPKDGSGEPVVLRHGSPVWTLAALGDGRLASGSVVGTVKIWPVDGTGEPVVLEHDSAVTSLAALADGRLASSLLDGRIELWPKDGAGEPAVLQHGGPVWSLAALGDGRLASGGADGTIRIWPGDGAGEPVVLRHGVLVRSLAALGDGRLASGGNDGSIRIWPSEGTGGPVVLQQGSHVRSLAVLGDGRLASGGSDGAIKIWRKDGAGEPVVLRHGAPVPSLVVLGDGRLASGGLDGSTRVWPREGPGEPVVLRHGGPVWSLAALGDERLASGGSDGAIKLWRKDGAGEPVVLQHGAPVPSLAVLGDGRLASGGEDGSVKIWPGDGAGEPAVLRHGGPVTTLAVFPDGRLASGGKDGFVKLWPKGGTGEPVVARHGGQVNSLAVLEDGRIASGGEDGSIKLWSGEGAGEPAVLQHGGPVRSVVALGDGRLASGGLDGRIKLWPRKGTGEPVVLQHGSPVPSLAVLGDGRLASGGDDGRIELWLVEDEKLIAALCLRAGRNLGKEEWARYVGSDTPWQPSCRGLPSNWRTPDP